MSDAVRTALVIGAGKIGRGFLGQLLHRSGYALWLVDGAPRVVDLLNAERRYRVDIAGRDDTEYIPVAGAFRLDQPDAVERIVARADVIVTAVGAPNIAAVAAFLRPMIAARPPGRPLNWFICENADEPAKLIRATLLDGDDGRIAARLANDIGIVETQVLRTGMEADPAVSAREPLAVRMHDWWTLPCDADAIRGPVPPIAGLKPRGGFAHELTRKVYTFNGLNGPISYLGYANGYEILHEAATAPELQAILTEIHAESAHGLIAEYGLDPEEHRAFQRIAWSKYRDPALRDAIERNARDSARKLGPRERLVGPGSLCGKQGRAPRAYATAIAAAIAYDGSTDDGTRRVQALVANGGIEVVLREICAIPADAPLHALVVDAWRRRAFRLRAS